MFHKTITKLTALYLAIIMVVSLFFSANIYRLSVQEFDRDVRRQREVIDRAPDFTGPVRPPLDRLIPLRETLASEAKAHILANLLVTNLAILVVGGFLSFYLARRTLRPIEEAHEALERFTADASHELRTPITAMKTETEVALMNPQLSLKQAKAQLRSILEELGKLTTLSDGLLRLARMKNADLPQDNLPLKDVLTVAVDRVSPLAQQKHITVRVPKTITGNYRGDKDSLVEALVIILENAIKYSAEKKAINITSSTDQHVVTLAIKDQGIGIKASELPHIFERFYRADSSRHKQGSADGYGLGLAIAKSIVDLHDGSISAKSMLGQGTTVTVQLPIAK